MEVRAKGIISTNSIALGVTAQAGPRYNKTKNKIKKNKNKNMVFALVCIYTLGAMILWSRSYIDLLLSLGSATEVLSALIVYNFYFLFVIIQNFRFQ